jgi:hypothetical protein
MLVQLAVPRTGFCSGAKPVELVGQESTMHRQLKCFHDLSDFQSRVQNVIVAQAVFILLSYTLRQWQLWRLHAEVSPNQTPELIRRRLNLRKQYIVIYRARSYAQVPLVRFTRLVLQLEGAARQRALAKIQNWSRAF